MFPLKWGEDNDLSGLGGAEIERAQAAPETGKRVVVPCDDTTQPSSGMPALTSVTDALRYKKKELLGSVFVSRKNYNMTAVAGSVDAAGNA